MQIAFELIARGTDPDGHPESTILPQVLADVLSMQHIKIARDGIRTHAASCEA